MASEPSIDTEMMIQSLSSKSLFEAAKGCLSSDITNQISNKSNSVDLVGKISKFMQKNHNESYLWSSKTAIRSDSIIVNRAKKWISNGFNFHGETYKLKKPFQWNVKSEMSRNHKYKIQSWYMIDEVLRAYEIENNDDFFLVSQSVALDWIEHFIFGNLTNEYTWYDMGTGQRAALLAYITQKSLLDLPKLNNTPKLEKMCDEILKLLITAQIHIVELMDSERLAFHSNHGLFQMSGLLAICKSLPILNQSKEGEFFALNSIEEMLREHYFLDGFHKEHSPMYHLYVSNYLHQLEEARWLPSNPHLENLSLNSKLSVQNFIMPDGYFAPIGDSSLSNTADALSLFPINLDSNGNPSAPPGIHVYPEGGVAIVASNDVNGKAIEHLVFNAQFHSRQHKHADDLSINYCAKGSRFLIDAGTFTYHYDQPERMYVESTRAHNTVEIDGMNYSRFRLDSFGSALNRVGKLGDIFILEGTRSHKTLIEPTIPNNQIKSTDAVSVDINHRRLIINKPENFLCVIDLLHSNEEHHFKQWFHISPQLKLESIQDGPIQILHPNGRLHSTIHHPKVGNKESDMDLTLGRKSPRIQGFHSINGLNLEPHSTIGFSKTGPESKFCTIFDLNGGMKMPYVNIGSNGKYVRVVIPDKEGDTNIVLREQKNGCIKVEYLGSEKEIFNVQSKNGD